MLTTTILRRVTATSAAISMGGMLFLCGCNHDNDCNSCDTSPAPYVHPRVSDNGRFEVQSAQRTGYAEADEPVLENDIYFRQHRLDSNFDRNEYFRDRTAYIRAHEGDTWWNDHHIELEASWNNRHRDRDEQHDIRREERRDERRDERNAMNGRSNTGFDREINSVQHPPSTATPADKEREPLNTSVENRNENRNELQNENRNEIRKSREEQRRMETPSSNMPGSEVKSDLKTSTDNSIDHRDSSRNTEGAPASSNTAGSETKRDNAR